MVEGIWNVYVCVFFFFYYVFLSCNDYWIGDYWIIGKSGDYSGLVLEREVKFFSDLEGVLECFSIWCRGGMSKSSFVIGVFCYCCWEYCGGRFDLYNVIVVI